MASEPVSEPFAVPDPGHGPGPVADPVAFRAALGRFPTGITVVSAHVDGADHAMTASAFASVSLDPPLVLVCVAKDVRFYDAVRAAPGWGVSVLGEGSRAVSEWLALPGRPLVGQLDRIPFHRAGRSRAPLLDAALATLDCRTWAWYDGGDHDIVVGEVVDLALPRPDGRPLVHYRGDYHQVGPRLPRKGHRLP